MAATAQAPIQGVPEGLTEEALPAQNPAAIQGVPEGLTEEALPVAAPEAPKSTWEKTKDVAGKAYDVASKAPAAIQGVADKSKDVAQRYGSSLASSVGVPTSVAEAAAAKPTLPQALAGPAAGFGSALWNSAKQAYEGQKAGGEEAADALQNIREGQPVWPNLGKAAYGYVHGALQSVPFVGAPVERMGQEIQNKNYAGALGSATGVAAQIAGPEALHEFGPKVMPAVREAIRSDESGLRLPSARPQASALQRIPTVRAVPAARSAEALATIKQPPQAAALGTAETPTALAAPQSGEALGTVPQPAPAAALRTVPTPATIPAPQSGEALGGSALRNPLATRVAPAAARASETGEALGTIPVNRQSELGSAYTPQTRPAAETGEALGAPKEAPPVTAKPKAVVERDATRSNVPYAGEAPKTAYVPPKEITAADVKSSPGTSMSPEGRAPETAKAPETAFKKPAPVQETPKPAETEEALNARLNEAMKAAVKKPAEGGAPTEDSILYQRAKAEKPNGTEGEWAQRAQEMKNEAPKYRRPAPFENERNLETIKNDPELNRRSTDQSRRSTDTGYVRPEPFEKTEGANETLKYDKDLQEFHRRAGDVKSEETKVTRTPQDVMEHVKANKPYGIITAENPNNIPMSAADNAVRNVDLEKDLRDLGYNPHPATSHFEGMDEHPFVVPDLTVEDAKALGNKHGQASVLTNEGLHDLKTGETLKSNPNKLMVGDEAKKQQAYTTIGDQHFSVSLGEEAAEAAKPEAAEAKPEETKTEEAKASPEDVNTVKGIVKDLTDQHVIGAGQQYDVEHKGYDFSKRDEASATSSGRHRVDRERFTQDVTDKIPEPMVQKLVRAADAFDNKDDPMFSNAERNGATKAARAKAIWDAAHEEGVKEKLSAKVGPEPTPDNALLSNQELLDKGYSQEQIDAGKHLPTAGGSAGGKTPGGIPDDMSRLLTPEEKAGITKSDKGRDSAVAKLMKMPDVQEFADIALQGEGGRKWYQRSAQAFEALAQALPEYFKAGDKDRFIDLLAAGSPQQTVKMNLQEALKVWTKYVDSGRPEGPALEKLLKGEFTLPGAKVPNAMKALAGEDLWPDISKNRNFKVPSFAANLKGWLNHVTSDGWQGLFAGIDAKELSSPTSYHPLAVATRAAAEALGWEPAEAQAAIWAFTKAFTEHGETDPEMIKQYSQDFADIIANDPDIQLQLKELGVDKETLDKHLANVEPKPEISGRTTPTTANSITRLSKRIEAKGRDLPASKDQGNLNFEAKEKGTEFNPDELSDTEVESALKDIKKNVTVLPKGKIDTETLNNGKIRHFLLSDGSMISDKVPIHSDIESKVGSKNLKMTKAIRVSGPSEYDVKSKPTEFQRSEISRLASEAGEETGRHKMYWSLVSPEGKELGNTGFIGDFLRDLDKVYGSNSEDIEPKAEYPEIKTPVEFKPTTTLTHYSNQAGLTETSPDKFGTGKAGAEKSRSKEPGFLPRTYFGMEGYKEPAIQSQAHMYTATVKPSDYYDIAKDPDKIWKKAYGKGGATAAENAVHDAGFKGYFHNGVVASFEKVPVKHVKK